MAPFEGRGAEKEAWLFFFPKSSEYVYKHFFCDLLLNGIFLYSTWNFFIIFSYQTSILYFNIVNLLFFYIMPREAEIWSGNEAVEEGQKYNNC